MDKNKTAVIPVVDNDTTFDGKPIDPAAIDQISLVVNAPFNGKAEHLLDHSGIRYTPDLDFTGADSFQYTITVGGITSMPATVSITVNSVDPPPPPITQDLKVKRAIAWTRGERIVARRGPRWLIMGTGAARGAEVTIEVGGTLIKKVKANRFGGWRFFGRAIPGLTNPTTITVSSPGAQNINIPLIVR
jgi:hypothetical protein